jgi:hypothetical protein
MVHDVGGGPGGQRRWSPGVASAKQRHFRFPQRPTTLTSRTSRTSSRLAMTNSTPLSHSLLRVQVSTYLAVRSLPARIAPWCLTRNRTGSHGPSLPNTISSPVSKNDCGPAAASSTALPLALPNLRWHQHRQRPFVPVLCRIMSTATTEWIPGLDGIRIPAKDNFSTTTMTTSMKRGDPCPSPPNAPSTGEIDYNYQEPSSGPPPPIHSCKLHHLVCHAHAHHGTGRPAWVSRVSDRDHTTQDSVGIGMTNNT